MLCKRSISKEEWRRHVRRCDTRVLAYNLVNRLTNDLEKKEKGVLEASFYILFVILFGAVCRQNLRNILSYHFQVNRHFKSISETEKSINHSDSVVVIRRRPQRQRQVSEAQFLFPSVCFAFQRYAIVCVQTWFVH